MKQMLLVILALVLGLSVGAFGRSLGLNNELLNGSWQSGDDLFWLVQGGGIVDLNTWFAGPGPAPGESDPYGYGIAASWTVNTGSVSQDYWCDPGFYEVDLSGWLQVKDGGWEYASWIQLELLVDDVLVASQRLEFYGPGGYGETGWVYKEVRWTGFVAGKKTVRIRGEANAWGGPGEWPWGIVYADGIDLEERIVPEPASILALAAGLGGLVIRRRVS